MSNEDLKKRLAILKKEKTDLLEKEKLLTEIKTLEQEKTFTGRFKKMIRSELDKRR